MTLRQEQDLNRLKSNFVSMVSHEFRTPLGVINSATYILKKYGDRIQTEERVVQIDEIQQAVWRLEQLMEDVLLKGKLDSGWIRLEIKPVEVRQEVSDCWKKVVSATACTHVFHLAIEHQVPKIVEIDPKILQISLTNLLTNAVKYSPSDRPIEGKVAYGPGDKLSFTIQDYGIGIPEADHASLFTAFYRASNSGHVAGTGLGLNIVKTCVTLHGGTSRSTVLWESAHVSALFFQLAGPKFLPASNDVFETKTIAS